MVDAIAIVIIVAILGSASYYIYKKKKSGAKCIGCPESGSSSCHCSQNK